MYDTMRFGDKTGTRPQVKILKRTRTQCGL
jgi:hypothetical protein